MPSVKSIIPPQGRAIISFIRTGRWVGNNVVHPMLNDYNNSVIKPNVTRYINNPSNKINMSMSPEARAFWKNAGQSIASLVGNALKNQLTTPRVSAQMPPAQSSYNLNALPDDSATTNQDGTRPSTGFDMSNPVVQVGLLGLAFWLLTKK